MSTSIRRPLDPSLVTFIAAARAAGADRFALRQFAHGMGESRVTESLPGEKDEAMAARFWERAHDDAAGVSNGLPQAYYLCAFKPGDDVYFERKPIRIAAIPMDGLRPSEDASATGVLALSMRHQEAMAMIHVEGASEAMDSLRKTNAELMKLNAQKDETIERLTSTNLETLQLREKFLSEENEREIAKDNALAKRQREDWALNTLAGIVVPALKGKIGALTGGAAPPAAAAPPSSEVSGGAKRKNGVVNGVHHVDPVAQADAVVTGALARFANTLDQDAVQRVSAVLSPEQQSLLFDVFQALRARAEVASERAASAPAEGTAS